MMRSARGIELTRVHCASSSVAVVFAESTDSTVLSGINPIMRRSMNRRREASSG